MARLLNKGLHQSRIAWTSTGIVVFCAFVWSNAFGIYRSHEENVVVPMTEVQKQLNLAAELDLPENTIIVYEDLVPNLIASSVTSQISLLASSVSNQLDEQHILERIVLHAKIFDWTEERLVEFFEPNQAFADYDSFKGRQVVTRKRIELGLGNWLLNYKKSLSDSERKVQLNRILEKYQSSKLTDLLAKHHVAAIVTMEGTKVAGFTNRLESGGYKLLTPTNAP